MRLKGWCVILNSRLMSFLGIAVKAGNVCFGYNCVRDAIYKREVKLILVASDLSKRSQESIFYETMEKNIELIQINYTMEDIGHACGKFSGILGIKSDRKDEGMALKIKELANEDYSGRDI